MMNRLSLKGKVLLMVMLNIMVSIIFNGLSIYTNINKSKIVQNITEDDTQSIFVLNELSKSLLAIEKNLVELNYGGLTKEQIKENVTAIASSIERYKLFEKKFQSIDAGVSEKEKFSKISESWLKLEPNIGKAISIFSNGKPSNAELEEYHPFLESKINPSLNEIFENLNGLINSNDEGMKADRKTYIETEQFSQIVLYGSVASQVILGLLLGFWLAIHLASRFNNLTDQLNSEVTNITQTSTSLAVASSELSASTTEQASALQETVAAIDEVNAMVQQNAENSKKSIHSADVSYSAVESGKKAINDMIVAIANIKESNESIMNEVENSNKEFTEIVKVIHDIGQKTKVINDIVFQTKLLSFNASVEAARAGEHGKGFAVVAEEVGNLAQMSGNAAKEITDMLDSSIQKVEFIVENTKTKVGQLIEDGKEKVQTGNDIALSCNSALEEIYTHVAEVKSMINSIATASQEQSQGVSEITKAMNQMDQVTQENSAASQKTSHSAESLKQQADRMKEMVLVLNSTVHGDKNPTPKKMEISKAKSVVFAKKSVASNVKDFVAFKEKKKVAPVATLKSEKQKSVKPLVASKPKKESEPKKDRSDIPASQMKEVSGGSTIPTHDDPRFEDV